LSAVRVSGFELCSVASPPLRPRSEDCSGILKFETPGLTALLADGYARLIRASSLRNVSQICLFVVGQNATDIAGLSLAGLDGVVPSGGIGHASNDQLVLAALYQGL